MGGKKAGLKGEALLALGQHATSRDILQATLQVAHLRHLPFRRDLDANAARVWALEESGTRAARDIDVFMSELDTQAVPPLHFRPSLIELIDDMEHRGGSVGLCISPPLSLLSCSQLKPRCVPTMCNNS